MRFLYKCTLSKFSEYIIPLRNINTGEERFEYKLTNDFFSKIDSPEVEKGKVSAIVNVKKIVDSFELSFQIEGVVKISCDRCLDEMDQLVSSNEKLIVKFGSDYAEEGSNIIVVPQSEGEINVAWFIFEFISLAIPIKHTHPYGKCNKQMSEKLREISAYDDESEQEQDIDIDLEEDTEDKLKDIDPRWDELKKIINNN